MWLAAEYPYRCRQSVDYDATMKFVNDIGQLAMD
jgi:hypothetical protein